jgi:hypothetical protein
MNATSPTSPPLHLKHTLLSKGVSAYTLFENTNNLRSMLELERKERESQLRKTHTPEIKDEIEEQKVPEHESGQQVIMEPEIALEDPESADISK